MAPVKNLRVAYGQALVALGKGNRNVVALEADLGKSTRLAKDELLYRKLRPMMTTLGCNMDPHQAYLVLRGLKTLSLRIERAQASALIIARWLERQPQVEWVRYVGLPSHPQHDLAKRQMSGFGAMIAFGLKGGLEAGRTVMDNLRLATLAVSLGGVETLIEPPASMTHAGMSSAPRGVGHQRRPWSASR